MGRSSSGGENTDCGIINDTYVAAQQTGQCIFAFPPLYGLIRKELTSWGVGRNCRC